MIRVSAIVALTLLLVLVFYLPAAFAPERFASQIRSEHQLQIELWGDERAHRILRRALDAVEAAHTASPFPDAEPPLQSDPATLAVAREMERVNGRLFGNAYFRSIDALLTLAAFRLQAWLAWLPLESAFILATLVDGLCVRSLRARELKPHDPERFSACGIGLVLIFCGALVAFVVPTTITPAMLGLLAPVAALLLSRLLANFHRAGH